ncbi:hypothetical protein DM02DRAFT_677399 [Periconia macrospinosa]|uniref:F-box domain-containing protein n=1 Tax=Periconia macrospinosa TaxID=97972 RepID=A0A2V1D3J3_9PLEO|nr:hypothetical protein DM02DRAFT_677399 [Periconia macrospinosa]
MSSEDGTNELPPYLARHFQLGFDADDLEAVMKAIDASQSTQSPTLPHLPAEVVCMILDHVPVDFVLSWRLVCCAFRDYIDGPLLYQYIQRTVLIAHFYDINFESYNLTQLEELKFLRAPFERMEVPSVPEKDNTERSRALKASHAIFRIDQKWMDALSSTRDIISLGSPLDQHLREALGVLQLIEDEKRFGTLRWCIRLDGAVGELDFPIEAARNSFTVDLSSGRLMLEWKDLLFRFLKTETLLRKTMAEKQGTIFTISRENDCLRAVRRQRLAAALDDRNRDHRRIRWEMQYLEPLFGRTTYDRVAEPRYALAENRAVNILMRLRKEAATSPKQMAHLRQLVQDRKEMEQDLDELYRSFEKWRSVLENVSPATRFHRRYEPWNPLANDPIAWTDEQVKSEEKIIRHWRSQKRVFEQMNSVLRASREAMCAADDALDSLASDAFDELDGDV